MVDFLGPAKPAFARAMRENGPMSRVRRQGSRAISTKDIDLRRNFQNPWTHFGVRVTYLHAQVVAVKRDCGCGGARTDGGAAGTQSRRFDPSISGKCERLQEKHLP